MGYKVTGALHADRLVCRELKKGDWWVRRGNGKPYGLAQAIADCPGRKEWVLEGNVSIPVFTKIEPPLQCSFLEVIPLLRAFPGSVAKAKGEGLYKDLTLYYCRWDSGRLEFKWEGEHRRWEGGQIDEGDLDGPWLYYPEGIPAE